MIGDAVDYSDVTDADLVVTLGANGAKTVVTATGMNASFANGEEIMNFESIIGGQGNDKLTGNAGNNVIYGEGGDDWIDGGAGNDILHGGSGNNTVSYKSATAGVTVNLVISTAQNTGGSGIDTIISFQNLEGSSKNDVLTGTAQANKIYGNDGNDVIEGGAGGDYLDGGAGVDTVSYANAFGQVTVDLNLQDGFTKQSGVSDENDDILIGFENLTGSQFHDTLIGDVNSNTIFGLGGNDTINGGRGADILDGGAGIDTLSYEDDNNAVTVTLGFNGAQTLATGLSHSTGDKISNFENIKGGSGNDILTGNNLDNKIWGGDGDDVIDGGLGDDWLNGEGGINTLSFASVNVGVTVNLGSAPSQNTGAGNDTIFNFHNLIGTSKDDMLTGDGGDNVIEGGAGNDTINGAGGSDTASYAGATAAVTVDLTLMGVAQNTKGAGIDSLLSIENLLGGKFNDTLIGNGITNKIDGGAGNDFITGGGGADVLTGGLGNDVFVYNSATEGGDTITDFGTGLDKIGILKSGFNIPGTVALNGAGVNNFAAEYFVSGSGAVATKAHGQFVFDTDTFQLYWDDDGTGGNAAQLIATFDNGYNLLATDFILT
jgi:Ca2+-binding RTX toxin-like protein